MSRAYLRNLYPQLEHPDRENVVGVVEEHNGNQVPAKTMVLCPLCGKPTGLRLGFGDAVVYCRHCPVEIEVSIHATEKEEGEQVQA